MNNEIVLKDKFVDYAGKEIGNHTISYKTCNL